MELVTVEVEGLLDHPENPNTHPADQLGALGESLAQFEQVKNVVVWRGYLLAGHGLRSAARAEGLATLEAVDVSEWEESKAISFMLADNRLAELAVLDEAKLAEAFRLVDAPLEVPGFDADFLKAIGVENGGGAGELGSGGDDAPPIDRAAELQEKWQCETGQIWQMESKANPGHYHRLICGDCRDTEVVAALVEGQMVNGVFTSPPYAMQRAKQYGGVPAVEYVDWWEAVQENVRGVLAEDGSFFVNIKPHCEDGQRVLYVFDLVLAMVRRWRWRFVEEYEWIRNGVPRDINERFRNSFEPIYHFAGKAKVKIRPDSVKVEPADSTIRRLGSALKSGEHLEGRKYKESGFSLDWGAISFQSMREGVYPDNVLRLAAEVSRSIHHTAPFPVLLPTFFIKAYSDPLDTWLDPFAGSGTVAIAAENERRLGLMIEQLPQYCSVILERFQDAFDITPELLT